MAIKKNPLQYATQKQQSTHDDFDISEQITHPHPALHDNRPVIVKPKQKLLIPQYNDLYDSLRSTHGGWRYITDFYVKGTTTIGFNTTNTIPINLTAPLANILRTSQWPGAVHAYLVLRTFSIGTSGSSNPFPTSTSVPATSGNLTINGTNGTLVSIVVTTTGSSNLVFTDGGVNTIAVVPSTATVGQIFSPNMFYGTSLIANKSTTTPVVTVTSISPFVTNTSMDCIFIDQFGNTVPLGEFMCTSTATNTYTALLPTPLTDPGNTILGNLIVSNTAITQGGMYYQFGFSIAYLLPAKQGYKIEEEEEEVIQHVTRRS